MKKILIALVLSSFLLGISIIVRADNCDLDCQINQVKNDLGKLNNALKSQTADYQRLSQQLENIKARIILLGAQIKQGEAALVYQKQLLDARAKSYYKNISSSSLSLVDILVSGNLSDSLRKFFYQKSLVDDDKRTIIKVVLYIKKLETEKASLADLQKQVDEQTKILSGQISQTKARIAELSARQEQLIAQKLASLNISRSAATFGRCDSDLTNGRDPGFGPKFAAFTYGVPNRVGMNQWGAKGRADAGQNEEEILRAYYNNFDLKKDYSQDITINVDGHGSYKIEEYLKHIFEIPSDWDMKALKAQAIAARSYALAYTNNGQSSICATEQCQVFHDEEKGGRWNDAVDATKGWVMVQGGVPIKAWFSSTHGGYVFSSGEIGWANTSWTKHATDVNGSAGSFSDLQNNAYDKSSPWFYCDWGSRAQYNKTAWLKPDELADIVNVLLLAKRDSSVQEHLYQTDNPPSGTDTWSAERVKSELQSRGITPFSNISDASVGVDFGSGRTTSVNVNGDGGSQSFDAKEFKNFFNLRAPANVQIVGPLYNIEKR